MYSGSSSTPRPLRLRVPDEGDAPDLFVGNSALGPSRTHRPSPITHAEQLTAELDGSGARRELIRDFGGEFRSSPLQLPAAGAARQRPDVPCCIVMRHPPRASVARRMG